MFSDFVTTFGKQSSTISSHSFSAMTSTQGHKFAQASWRIIREFAGIYGVKMDYSKIKTLCGSTIADAVNHSKTIKPCLLAAMRREPKYFRRPAAWKSYLLKQISNGYKSRKFYEEIALRILLKDKVWREQNAYIVKMKADAEERIRENRWARVRARQSKWGATSRTTQ